MMEEGVPERAAELGAYLGDGLRRLAERHACVSGVEGFGMLWAVELVRPDGSGERFVPEDRHLLPTGSGFAPSRFVAEECAKRGMTLATAPPNTLRIGPSLSTSRENLDRGIEILDEALSELDRRG